MRGAVLAAVACALLAAGCGGAARAEPFSGDATLPGSPVAPGFTLHDADGRTVRLADFRGRPVLLTFIYAHCPDVCPLIVGNLHAALEQLGPRGRGARVIAVSVDPDGDRPSAVRAFVRARDLADRMSYLIGTRRELAAVWRAYGVGVQGSPEDRSVGHTATVYGIGASGRERVHYTQDFTIQQIVHDVPLLATR